ncbi:MAG: hypothetical protein ACTSVG_02635 [Alphaproteobacteria bacterium]
MRLTSSVCRSSVGRQRTDGGGDDDGRQSRGSGATPRAGLTGVLGGLTWLGLQARWVLAVGVVLATLLPGLSSFLRPFLPGLVALILCTSMVRLDLGALARRACRPRRLAILAAWSAALLVATPAAVWAGALAAGLPKAHVAALVYTFAAPPISSAPALCLLLGLDAAFALELTMVASLAMPFIGPVVTRALLGEAVPLDAFDLALRVAAMIAAGVVAALVLRHLIGAVRIARHDRAFDGVATVVLVLFVIPLFDGFWGVVRGLPLFALGSFALVLAANWGAQVVVALAAARGSSPGIAGAAGLMWGNRNVSIYLAALPPDPLFGLYVALYQLPMLFTPLVLGRLLGGRGAGRGR